jgi:hypothetical protein
MKMRIINVKENDSGYMEFKIKAAKDFDDENEDGILFTATYGKEIVESGEWKKLLKAELERLESAQKNKENPAINPLKDFADKYLGSEFEIIGGKPEIKLKKK